MIAYLIKKVALNNKVYCLGWSKKNNFIACGGESGFFKILKYDHNLKINENIKNEDKKFLSLYQNLEGHIDSVIHLNWNDNFDKLISSDVKGLVIVWIYYKGIWYEEMINNRNKSIVIELKWTSLGDKICIVFEDGSVIVGSVDGNRLWTKEIKNIKLTCAEWSPDGKFILFGSSEGNVHCYDYNGNFFTKIQTNLKNNNKLNYKINHQLNTNSISVVNINWFDNKNLTKDLSKNKKLAIALSNGEIHLLNNEFDDEAKIYSSNFLIIRQLRWNPNGEILAVCGTVKNEENVKNENYIHFIDDLGNLLYCLKVPGNELIDCSWDKTSTKLIIGIDEFILFANVRLDYKWVYFEETFAIHLSQNFNSTDVLENELILFYQIKNKKSIVKNIQKLLNICCKNQFCCFAEYLIYEDNSKTTLNLCNKNGTTIDVINIDFEIKGLTMNNSFVIAISNDSFCIWKFKTPDLKNENLSTEEDEFNENLEKISYICLSKNELINCCDCSDKYFILNLNNSSLLIYTLPKFNLTIKLKLNNFSLKQIKINSSSTILACLDKKNNLKFLDLNKNTENNLEYLIDSTYKDIWDFKWSEDNNLTLFLNQKSNLLIKTFNKELLNKNKEEKIGISNGNLYDTKFLNLKIINLDEFYCDLNDKKLNFFIIDGYIQNFESKLTKLTKKLFKKGNLNEISDFIEKNSYYFLWKLLIDYALEEKNLEIAELALIKSRNYKGIQFLKHLKKLTDSNIQNAEINLYLNKKEKAKRIYQSIGRLDLESEMYKLFGDWLSLINLTENELGVDEISLNNIYNNLAIDYYEKKKYNQAIEYFIKSNNHNELKKCYIKLEKHNDLIKLMSIQNLNNDFIDLNLGEYFESIGNSEEAVKIYLKFNDYKKAIDCYINLNEWNKAIELSQKYLPDKVNSILNLYSEQLENKNDFAIIEIFRKTKNYEKAIHLLIKLIEKHKDKDFLKMKKFFTMVGILWEEKNEYEKKDAKNLKINFSYDKLTEKLNESKIKNYWKGAEAYHFYLLSQKQLINGLIDASMKTSLVLVNYEEYIDTEIIYSLIALTSALNNNFFICSKAFLKLESIENNELNLYKNLAFQIFSKHTPILSKNINQIECPYCESKNLNFSESCINCETKFTICIASGRQILSRNNIWVCEQCKHSAINSDLNNYQNCPLCHKKINSQKYN